MPRIKASRNGTKKDAITKKAAMLFRKKGFTASSMRELAENIGVEAPSLYNHIGSKSEILQTICFKIADDFTCNLSEIEKNEKSAIRQLEDVIRFHINMMVNVYDEVYVANHEWRQLKEPYLANFLNQRKNYESRLREIVIRGIAAGEIKKIHPYVAVLTILSALRGLENWQKHKKNIPVEELEADMITHLLKGLIK